MGSVWLNDLDAAVKSCGVGLVYYDNDWRTRSRSSGGYERVLAIGYHHDASSAGSSDQANEDYCWRNANDRPIGCMRLRRNGVVSLGAAGATNTMGKGGPLTCSKGTVPKDDGNRYMIAIEAANNGTGERWPKVMMDAYIALVDGLAKWYGLDVNRDVYSHHWYCQPSCPGRKIDPAGPADGYPTLGTSTWSNAEFCKLLSTNEEDEVTDEDIDKIAKRVWTYVIHYAKQNVGEAGEHDAAEPASSVLGAAASYAGRATR